MTEQLFKVAFLNFKRDLTHVKNNITNLSSVYNDLEFIVCSDKNTEELTKAFEGMSNVKFIPDVTVDSVAKAKNIILRKLRDDSEVKSDVGFIIEDDVIIDSQTVLQEYATLIKKFETGVIYFGFSGIINSVFNVKNPRLKVKCKDGSTILFNQIPCGALICFNLAINKHEFNEELKYLELKEYSSKLEKDGLLQFVGVFIDVEDSFTKLHTDDSMQSIRNKDPRMVHVETELLRKNEVEYKPIGDLNKVIEYVNSKIKE
jgi:hypothetical protein